MYLTINGTNYEVIIERKIIKHTYLRVKEDLKIYISTSKLTNNKEIEKLLSEEIVNIKKMIIRQQKKMDCHNLILGKEVDIVVVSNLSYPEIYNGKFYIKNRDKIDIYLKKIALDIYKERLEYLYSLIEEDIPYPVLKVRKMKTRWGVCNRKNNTITINLDLIRKDIKYIDYVIIHELCHFIHFDHSKLFWNLVGKYYKNYKVIRKELRN